MPAPMVIAFFCLILTAISIQLALAFFLPKDSGTILDNDNYIWNFIYLYIMLLSMVLLFYIANKLISWAIFPYTAGFVHQ